MPSQFIYDIAYVINQIFPSDSMADLMNMPIEQFWDLASYSINTAFERKNEESTGNNVNNITNPTPIKNGGWF